MITYHMVPFPTQQWLEMQVLITGASKALRSLAKKWHPDSFWNKFGVRICAADKEKIMSRVTETFQTLSNLASKHRR